MSISAFLLAPADGQHSVVQLPDTPQAVTPSVAEAFLPGIRKPYGYINVARYMHDITTDDGQMYAVLYEPRNLVTESNSTISNMYSPGEELWHWYGNIVVVALKNGKLGSVELYHRGHVEKADEGARRRME